MDLDNLDIGASIKISSIELPENVTPTIQGRDFVVATVAAPTIVKEPEKPAEESTEGAETTTEGAEASTESPSDPKAAGDEKTKDGEKKEEPKTSGEKK